ncbi:glycoside hydrolase family 10 protein [Auriscalpium vulgare]|uniref:Glycoside hydrolase family 10 protein n=1 Tax=Auriscalpium vulgare TaxID=40419 RepID=A0ACB8RR35_9AGAM|nr:glycoside hydrolase family 10 protein [Auriscalpium vulgare]
MFLSSAVSFGVLVFATLPVVYAQLNLIARATGKLYFGTATDIPVLNDTAYTAILNDTKQFGQITAENSMKWLLTEPSRGNFTFQAADTIAHLAETQHKLLRGHNCVWHNQLPDWVTAGNFSAPVLASIITTHCSTLVSRYRGHVYVHSWDVVNEPFNEDGTFQSNVFFDTLNISYIPIALHSARSADPLAKLYINEFNIEYAGPKSTGMQNLVKSLKRAGVPIQGIGLQFHMTVGEVPSTAQLAANMAAFTALGVEVAITELDVRMTLPATPALLAQQKADYEAIIAACHITARCVGVTVWDFTDKYSWVPGAFAGLGAACPWDENLEKKPAYEGIVKGFL